MERTVNVGDVEVRLKTSAALPRIYRLKFNRDIFTDISKLTSGIAVTEDGFSNIPPELLTIFENIAYTMAKYADPEQPDEIDEWLEQFDTFDIYMVLPEIISMWNFDNRTTSTAKKKQGR